MTTSMAAQLHCFWQLAAWQGYNFYFIIDTGDWSGLRRHSLLSLLFTPFNEQWKLLQACFGQAILRFSCVSVASIHAVATNQMMIVWKILPSENRKVSPCNYSKIFDWSELKLRWSQHDQSYTNWSWYLLLTAVPFKWKLVAFVVNNRCHNGTMRVSYSVSFYSFQLSVVRFEVNLYA
jgi:hypothetical protein